jgi:hypothetical protein
MTSLEGCDYARYRCQWHDDLVGRWRAIGCLEGCDGFLSDQRSQVIVIGDLETACQGT